MNDLQEIELNSTVKTKIGVSKIHGVGLMALLSLEKGEKLYADNIPRVYTLPYSSFGKLFPEIKELLLGQFPQIVNGSHFAYPTTRLQAYVNHSNEPNYDAVNDVMLKDVRAGEEITENYKLIKNYKKVFKWLD